jgi:hypothetical protein
VGSESVIRLAVRLHIFALVVRIAFCFGCGGQMKLGKQALNHRPVFQYAPVCKKHE